MEKRRHILMNFKRYSFPNEINTVVTFTSEFYVDKYFERIRCDNVGFQISNRHKRRYSVRGDAIWFKKWICHEILHRYSNAFFTLIQHSAEIELSRADSVGYTACFQWKKTMLHSASHARTPTKHVQQSLRRTLPCTADLVRGIYCVAESSDPISMCPFLPRRKGARQ